MDSDEEETNFYDEVEIEDMSWDQTRQTYFYPCPCGDMFQVTLVELLSGDDIGICPTCSLMIKVIYDKVDRNPIFVQNCIITAL